MLDRGKCTFVTKSKNIEKLGGVLALIVDNVKERSDYINMADDGNGHNVHIPAYFISKEDGDKIKATLNKTNDGVMIRASLDISNSENTVVYQLWYASPFDFVNWDLKGF
jgi:hypothetical protein